MRAMRSARTRVEGRCERNDRGAVPPTGAGRQARRRTSATSRPDRQERAIPPSFKHDITVIGGSAGAIGVLRELLASLPVDYPAAVFVVVHVAPDSPSVLADILNRCSKLPVSFARTNAPIRPGTVVVAPPDRHLILEGERVVLSLGPRENGHRPSIDVMFRSAALAFGSRVTGVVLSGMLDDGTAGLWTIKRRRGLAMVQDPDEAEFPDMPRNAMDGVQVDQSLSVRDLGAALMRIATTPAPPAVAPAPRDLVLEVNMAEKNNSEMAKLDEIGTRAPYSCPECGGALWEIEDGGPRFRCHVGHAYSARALAAEQRTRVEAALWAALRRLEESERLAARMAQAARVRGNERSAQFHEDVSRGSAAHADTLRELLTDPLASPSEPLDEAAGD